jgi:hypothetical protein
MYIHMFLYINIYMFTCIFAEDYSYNKGSLCIHINMYIHIFIHININVCLSVYIQIPMYM